MAAPAAALSAMVWRSCDFILHTDSGGDLVSFIHALAVARKLRDAVESAPKTSETGETGAKTGEMGGSGSIPWVLHLIFSFICTVTGGSTVALLCGLPVPLLERENFAQALNIFAAWWLLNFCGPLVRGILLGPSRHAVSSQKEGIFGPLFAFMGPFMPAWHALLSLLVSLGEAGNRTRSLLKGATYAAQFFPGSPVAHIVLVTVAGCGGTVAFAVFRSVCLPLLRLPSGGETGRVSESAAAVSPSQRVAVVLGEFAAPSWALQSAFAVAVGLLALGGSSVLPEFLPWGPILGASSTDALLLLLLVTHAVLGIGYGTFVPTPLRKAQELFLALFGIDDVRPAIVEPQSEHASPGRRRKSPSRKSKTA
jgi:hypothetical protein